MDIISHHVKNNLSTIQKAHASGTRVILEIKDNRASLSVNEKILPENARQDFKKYDMKDSVFIFWHISGNTVAFTVKWVPTDK